MRMRQDTSPGSAVVMKPGHPFPPGAIADAAIGESVSTVPCLHPEINLVPDGADWLVIVSGREKDCPTHVFLYRQGQAVLTKLSIAELEE